MTTTVIRCGYTCIARTLVSKVKTGNKEAHAPLLWLEQVTLQFESGAGQVNVLKGQ